MTSSDEIRTDKPKEIFGACGHGVPCHSIYRRLGQAEGPSVTSKALLDQMGHAEPGSGVPSWLQRCSEPRRRMVLFVAGASLILISLVCFAPEPKR